MDDVVSKMPLTLDDDSTSTLSVQQYSVACKDNNGHPSTKRAKLLSLILTSGTQAGSEYPRCDDNTTHIESDQPIAEDKTINADAEQPIREDDTMDIDVDQPINVDVYVSPGYHGMMKAQSEQDEGKSREQTVDVFIDILKAGNEVFQKRREAEFIENEIRPQQHQQQDGYVWGDRRAERQYAVNTAVSASRRTKRWSDWYGGGYRPWHSTRHSKRYTDFWRWYLPYRNTFDPLASNIIGKRTDLTSKDKMVHL